MADDDLLDRITILENEVETLKQHLMATSAEITIENLIHALVVTGTNNAILRRRENRSGLEQVLAALLEGIQGGALHLKEELATIQDPYDKVYEVGKQGRMLKMGSKRTTIPEGILDVALKRQKKEKYTNLSFYPYRECLDIAGKEIPYIALFDHELPEIDTIKAAVDEKNRVYLPSVQVTGVLKGKERIVFVGMFNHVGVFKYENFKGYRAAFLETCLAIQQVRKVLFYREERE